MSTTGAGMPHQTLSVVLLTTCLREPRASPTNWFRLPHSTLPLPPIIHRLYELLRSFPRETLRNPIQRLVMLSWRTWSAGTNYALYCTGMRSSSKTWLRHTVLRHSTQKNIKTWLLKTKTDIKMNILPELLAVKSRLKYHPYGLLHTRLRKIITVAGIVQLALIITSVKFKKQLLT